tara:strand:- start:62 stop:397 length:336 start_codon:yes stop_codon:yes gene_type:complete
MIKCAIYKLNTRNTFTDVSLTLCPKEIVILFREKTFSILHSEVISFSVKKRGIHIEISGGKDPLNIVIRPHMASKKNVIYSHLNDYCKQQIVEIKNPMFLRGNTDIISTVP